MSVSRGTRAARGMIRSRSSWVGACREMAGSARPRGPSSASLSGRPTLDTVMRRRENPRPRSWLSTSRALARWPRLSSGSPMPMNTRFLSGLRPCSRAYLRATSTWPRISPLVRLRVKPMSPVAQKVQPMGQPTWVDRHWVSRPSPGMSTVSTSAPSAMRRRNFTVPSRLTFSVSTPGQERLAASPSFFRNAPERLVMSAKSGQPFCHTHWNTWLARKRLSPRSRMSASSSEKERSSRFISPSSCPIPGQRETFFSTGAFLQGPQEVRLVEKPWLEPFFGVKENVHRGSSDGYKTSHFPIPYFTRPRPADESSC